MTDPQSRFHSTATYSAHARRHDYTVTVHLSPWRTKVVALSIDGIEHLTGDDAKAENDPQGIGVRVRGWLTVRIVVRRPTVEGKMVDREEIHVSTSVLGGAGEAEVHSGSERVPLLPESGSKSEQRDLKRTANPTAYALIAGLTTALRLCIPLLGLGALLSFLTEPVQAWLSRHLTPILEPVFQWLGRLLEPVGRALSAMGHGIGRILDVLFGWLPDTHLPFDVPDWVWTMVKIALLALLAFTISRSNLERRKKHLEHSQSGSVREGDQQQR